MSITLEVDEEVFLSPYRPLLNSTADIDFLWGGRDSGKSVFIAQRLLLKCLSAKYFRGILVKKTAESIKDSQWQLLQDWAVKWGIDKYFYFKVSPLEIICTLNGNKFICRGCDNPGKLKSISNPSDVWYEEGNQLTEADYITISTTLRSEHGKVKEWFSFNPEADDDYEDFWLYRDFFKEYFEKGETTFNGTHVIELSDGSKHELKYTSTHTVYQDNPHCTPDRIARHEQLRKTNPYYYNVFTKGLWGRRIAGGEFYKCYKQEKHVARNEYNPDLPLHLTFDSNVNPYMTGLVFQIDGKKVMQLNEFLLPHPRNTSLAVCDEFERKYPEHSSGLYIYGDPAMLKQSTADETTVRVKEKDYSEFTKIMNRLSKYRPQLRVPRAYPPVKPRGMFMNSIFEDNYGGIEILFHEDCRKTQLDFANGKEASDGTKHKQKVKDEITEVQYEKYHHVTDATDYMICAAFPDEFSSYLRGSEAKVPDHGNRSSPHGY